MKTFTYLETYGHKCRMTLHWKKSQYYLANISSRSGLLLCSWFDFSTMRAWSFTQTAAEHILLSTFTHLYRVLVLSALRRAFLYTQLFWSFKLEPPFLWLGTRTPFIGYSIARNEMMNCWYVYCGWMCTNTVLYSNRLTDVFGGERKHRQVTWKMAVNNYLNVQPQLHFKWFSIPCLFCTVSTVELMETQTK